MAGCFSSGPAPVSSYREAIVVGVMNDRGPDDGRTRSIHMDVRRLHVVAIDGRQLSAGILSSPQALVEPGQRTLIVLGMNLDGDVTYSVIEYDFVGGRQYWLRPHFIDDKALAEMYDPNSGETLVVGREATEEELQVRRR